MQISPPPAHILLVKPCCIGDVVFTLPLLKALRRAYPAAHLTWAVGDHSIPAIQHHPALNAVLPTGPAANPARTPGGLVRLVHQFRSRQLDLAVVPARTPLLGLATWLAGIPNRAGLDSAGRGLFYNIRAPVDPHASRHEAEIYLDIARALSIDTTDCFATIPVTEDQIASLPAPLRDDPGLIVVHVGGGVNPGMKMHEKRPPIELLATVAARAAAKLKARIAVLGGPEDRPRADELHEALPGLNLLSLIGILDFSQIAALGHTARLVVGPDTGLMHLMAAAGAPTVMIFGPSDPHRYGPFTGTQRATAIWKPYPLPPGGVAAGPPKHWNWQAHGPTVEEVWAGVEQVLNA
ncbi:MAG: glycosyltransferase family 9 protein [Anaerolineae bacterium]